MLEFQPFHAYEWKIPAIDVLIWIATFLFTELIGHRNKLDWGRKK